MLVKLKVKQATFNDILGRICDAGQGDRVSFDRTDGYAINLRDVAVVVDKENPDRGL